MQEKLLYHLWQNQLFDKSDLRTTSKESISVLRPGYLNQDSGPDFSEAKIEIEDLTCSGQVEIHVKSSDWDAHRHQEDDVYNGVILHVVWEKDRDILRADGTEPPTLELAPIVNEQILNNHKSLISTASEIVCGRNIDQVDSISSQLMIDKALVERLESKSTTVLDMLTQNSGDWEKTSIQWTIANFGLRSNRDVFTEYASRIDIGILQKLKRTPELIEPFLFGQAGMLLGKSKDEYHAKLKTLYHHLTKKYELEDLAIKQSQWKVGRLRPANFPTIRIAQIATLLRTSSSLFSKIIFAETLEEIIRFFRRPVHDYWHDHVLFGSTSGIGFNVMGTSSAAAMIINVVSPLLTAYSIHTQDPQYMDRALNFMEGLPAEKNRIIRKWENLGIEVANAGQSQGLIQLYTYYCIERNCLNCGIGQRLLSKAP